MKKILIALTMAVLFTLLAGTALAGDSGSPCTGCGDSEMGYNYDLQVVVNTHTKICAACGHEWIEPCVSNVFVDTTEPTCTEPCKINTKCKCGSFLRSWDNVDAPALGHDDSGADATCTTPKICNRGNCGHVLVEALGHDESGADATCTADKVCAREGCDYVFAEKLGHDKSGADATCTTDKVCAREGCGYVLVEALGHDESGADATCTADKVCAREGCGCVLVEALGHDESGADATCTADKVCAREGCGCVLAEKLGHDKSGADATCTADKVCARKGCNYVLVKAKGHWYGLWASNEDGTHSAACKRESCKYIDKTDCAAWEVTETKNEIAAILTVCPVCGKFGEATFEAIAEAKIACEKLPKGEAIVRGMETPFEGALYAFTAGVEYGGRLQEIENVEDGKIFPITITLPINETIREFTLVRVDVTSETNEAERTEVWTEIAYTFEDGILSFETEADGLFLLLPAATEKA